MCGYNVERDKNEKFHHNDDFTSFCKEKKKCMQSECVCDENINQFQHMAIFRLKVVKGKIGIESDMKNLHKRMYVALFDWGMIHGFLFFVPQFKKKKSLKSIFCYFQLLNAFFFVDKISFG